MSNETETPLQKILQDARGDIDMASELAVRGGEHVADANALANIAQAKLLQGIILKLERIEQRVAEVGGAIEDKPQR